MCSHEARAQGIRFRQSSALEDGEEEEDSDHHLHFSHFVVPYCVAMGTVPFFFFERAKVLHVF